MTFGHFIDIKQYLLLSFKRALLTAINGIFLPFLITSVVIVSVLLIGNRAVILLDTAFHFFKKLILQIFGRLQQRFRIFIFVPEVIKNFRIIPLVQPIVIIHPGISVYG